MPRLQKIRKLEAFGATLVPLAAAAVLFWMAPGAGSLAHEPGETGHGKPFLGVVLEEETEYSEGGARVTGVVGNSAAEEAGLREGDIIVGFDGRTIRGPRALTEGIRDHEAGDRVEVVVMRDGGEQRFDVELGSKHGDYTFVMPEDLGERIQHDLEGLKNLDFNFNFGECEGEDCAHYHWRWSGRPTLGVQLGGTTPELRRHLGGDGERGMLVTRVLADTPAEQAGIAVGDLIVAIDGEPVESAGDIRRAIGSKAGASVQVEVIRDRRSQYIDVAIREAGREAARAQREAMSEARSAMREAMKQQRRAVAAYRTADVI